MQKITEQQIKTIAKEIVKLSKNNTPIKHSSVLEVISHSLGYRDYNGLNNSLKQENIPTVEDNKDVSKIAKSEKILVETKNIDKELKICPNCRGEGYFILGPLDKSASAYYDYEYGDISAVTLNEKECFWCFGIGKTTNKRIKQVENMKKEVSYSN